MRRSRYSAEEERRQAGFDFRARSRASQPRPPKPASAIAQVDGSGAVGGGLEIRSIVTLPSPIFSPATISGSVNADARNDPPLPPPEF
jgi:hypothetical protein